MLQAIRDRATGWIAWVIIIIICIPFALWGVHEFNTTDRGLVVARVNDTEIGYSQYRSAYQQQRERVRQMFGGSVPAEILDGPRLRKETLEGLIADELLVQMSVANGLRVGDAQLARAIGNQPTFQADGRFSEERYNGYLRARGTSAAGFEQDLRRSMLGEQVTAALQRTVIVTEPELDRAMRIRNEERRYQVLELDPGKVQVPDPSDDAIRESFESHPEQFVKPEQVTVRYVELARDAIASKITGDEAALRADYEREKANYRVAEQREARHILINVPRDADDAAVAAAREQIEALRARVVAGEDFAEVARQSSQDPGSAPLGGSLGRFGRGLMDPAFEEAAFSLDTNVISEPVRSRFGWHLIQVTAVQPEQVRSFEEARADVLRQYQDREADQLFAEQAERLANVTFEHPQSLDQAAQDLGLEIKSSGWFSRDGEGATGVAAETSVREAAFSDDVLSGGNNSALLQVGSDRVLVVRVSEHENSRPHTLDEVRDRIAAQLRKDAASKAVRRTGEQLLEALRGGADMTEAASAENLTWSEERAVVRERARELPQPIVEALFKVPFKQMDPVQFAGTALPDGGYAVLALHAVGQAVLDDASARDARDRVVRSLEAGYGEQDFRAVMRGLRESSDVQILEQNLSQRDG